MKIVFFNWNKILKMYFIFYRIYIEGTCEIFFYRVYNEGICKEIIFII